MVREWPYFGIHFMIADGDILRKNLWFADSDILGSPLRFVGGQIPGGGTPLYGLYGDVPLVRVWFLASLS